MVARVSICVVDSVLIRLAGLESVRDLLYYIPISTHVH